MRHNYIILFLFLFLFSCDRISQNKNSEAADNEYLPPSTTTLKFTSLKPFTWLNSSANKSLPDPVFIDIERLPKEPLDLLDFKPFKTPVTQKILISKHYLLTISTSTLCRKKSSNIHSQHLATQQ